MSRKRMVLTCAAVSLGLGALAIPIAANAGSDNDLSTTCGVADGAGKWWASGRLALSNQGKSAAKDWKLEFEVSEGQATIDNPWAFKLVQNGKRVTVTPIEDRGAVPAKGERLVNVGINPGGKAVPQITGCKVNGSGGSQDPEPPTAPEETGSYVIDHRTVHVMWKPSTGFGSKIAKYEVFQDGKPVKTVGGDISMTNVEGLTPDTAYKFKVRAVTESGKTSAFSKEIQLKTKKAPDPGRPAPTIPKKLDGKASGPYQASLTWQTGKDGDGDPAGVTGYRIYRDGAKVQDVDAGATTATVGGLSPDTAYKFRVTAVNSAGKESAPTDEAAVRTDKAPDGGGGGGNAPGGLTASASSKHNGNVTQHYLNLKWSVPTGQGQIGTYQVYLDGKPAQTFMWGTGDPVMPIPSGTATREVLVGDKAGRTFKVKIRAKLGDGKWSAFSEEKTVTTGR
ncbi:fibronectin type III domain-containing protein [Streptomyces sp. NPDC051183]|uniref:fibronectin type III domain-containing protein n=1 Tax=Streptomyces sp. NPDC051183 TaxID=3155165 RepID=UPI00343A34C9